MQFMADSIIDTYNNFVPQYDEENEDMQPQYTELVNVIADFVVDENHLLHIANNYGLNDLNRDLMDMRCVEFDFYAFLRMFKKFENTGLKHGPPRADNIIVYAGDFHALHYRCMLDSLGFKEITSSGNYTHQDFGNFFIHELYPDSIQSAYCTGSGSCLDISNFKQPFFL